MRALSRRMQCGCADRRAANGEDVADIVQLGILRMLQLSRGVSAWRTTPLLRFAAADDLKGRVCRDNDETGWKVQY
jgi:hypothetical protein